MLLTSWCRPAVARRLTLPAQGGVILNSASNDSLAADRLTETILTSACHQCFDLRNQLGRASERQFGVNPLHEREQSQLFESPDLALKAVHDGQIGQRCPAP